jgi:tetratricopeptide (TPR) repeat protein
MQLWKIFKLGKAIGDNDASQIEILCTDALSRNPKDYMALTQLANMYWRNALDEDAQKCALRALEIEPVNFYALRIAACIYAKRDEGDLAYHYAKKLIIAADADTVIKPFTKLTTSLLKQFWFVPKLHRIETNAVRDLESRSKWIAWANDYVSRYESRGTYAP